MLRPAKITRTAGLLFASLWLAGCATTEAPALAPFSSDGCSLFPDSSLLSNDDWCSCCVAHDLAYWRGGTADERKAADQALRECVDSKTGSKALAGAMYSGVRMGGSPYFPTWFRWGYGWDLMRGYQPLTTAEDAQVGELLRQFERSPEVAICNQNDYIETESY